MEGPVQNPNRWDACGVQLRLKMVRHSFWRYIRSYPNFRGVLQVLVCPLTTPSAPLAQYLSDSYLYSSTDSDIIPNPRVPAKLFGRNLNLRWAANPILVRRQPKNGKGAAITRSICNIFFLVSSHPIPITVKWPAQGKLGPKQFLNRPQPNLSPFATA